MPTWLLPLIMQIVINIPGLIKTAEAAFSGRPGNGEAKKALVMDSVTSAMNIVQTVNKAAITPDQSAAILGTVSALTDVTVKAFHTADLFVKPSTVMTPTSVESPLLGALPLTQ